MFRGFARVSWENYCIVRTVVSSICEASLRKLLYYPNCCYEYLWGFLEKTIVLSELLFRVLVRLPWENYCIIQIVVSSICEAFLRKLLYYPNYCFEDLWGFLEKTIVLSELLLRVFVRLSKENYCIIRTIVTIICEASLKTLLYYPKCCFRYFWGFLEKTTVLSELLFPGFARLSSENYCIIRTFVSSICEAFLRKLLYYPNCFYEYLWGFLEKTIVLYELLFRVFMRLPWENYCIIQIVVSSICEAFLR